jgi:hypothetical protein
MESLIVDQSPKCQPMTFEDIPNVTGSQESAAGVSHCSSPGGQVNDQSGPGQRPVSRSVQRASKKPKKTNVTCGLKCSGSSESASLTQSLANRLRQQLATVGSMEYQTTWKQKVTPSGRSYWEQVLSPRRTNDQDCGGWPSPAAQNADGGVNPNGNTGEHFTLQTAAQLTAWPSPTSLSFNESHQPGNNRSMNATVELVPWGTPTSHERTFEPRQVDHGIQLANQAQLTPWNTPRATDGSHGGPNQAGGALPSDAALTAWATPSTRDHKDTPGMETTGINPDGSERTRLDQLPRQAHGVSIESLTVSTGSRGVLDAAFSRWLMGFPATWDEASPKYQSWCEVQERIALGG